ncbi:FKBP-type peptidyl-prolyl cis-trans isomerase, partial [bacterium]
VMGFSKLGIKDTKVGTGIAAQPCDVLTVDYTGKLAKSGKVFDSSVGNPQGPLMFILGVSRVIEGWQKGLVGMKAGGKRTLSIPAAMGYGERGYPPDIPPHADLVFEVELKKIARAKVVTVSKGTGLAAGIKDSIEVHYRGTLADGKEFVSSYGRDTLLVDLGGGQIVPGLRQGLYAIRKGEKRKVVIPPDLAYGEAGLGTTIPPNATVTFEIEAIKIYPAK